MDACIWLCELVLEEVVRLAAPGSASLDLGEPRVMTYTTELCKVGQTPTTGKGRTVFS